MAPQDLDPSGALRRLPDGTIRQVSPLTGTVVWTVPGRANRPIPPSTAAPRPLAEEARDSACAFCPERYLEATPEKARLVLASAPPSAGPLVEAGPDARLGVGDPSAGPAAPGDPSPPAVRLGVGGPPAGPSRPGGPPPPDPWRILRHVPADQLSDTTAAFRRIPNLFEILPLEYWQSNHGFTLPDEVLDRARAYVATPAGREHILGLMRTRLRAAGASPEQVAAVSDEALLERCVRLFDGTHDLVIARRHFVDGATHDDELASSGDLSPLEHHAYLALTVDTLRELAGENPFARYVAVFQNWLRPAGASFDHLHKQLVAIDELGPQLTYEVGLLGTDADLFNTAIADPAARNRLVIAENDHALALAGVGHRYPTVEVYATGPATLPWELSSSALRGVSDVLHACHAATGRAVATNEEWHYCPAGLGVAMPWRINLKWRISTQAGFEGGTKIYVNTIDPFTLRDRMVEGLRALRDAGRIGPMAIGDECSHRLGALRYAG